MQMYYISKNKVNMNIDWSHFAISSLKESVCPDRYNELTQIKKQESYVWTYHSVAARRRFPQRRVEPGREPDSVIVIKQAKDALV